MMIYRNILYRPVVTPSPLERGQGVCEFSLINRKITHPLSPLERGNRYSRRYVTNTKYTGKSSFIGSKLQNTERPTLSQTVRFKQKRTVCDSKMAGL